MIKKRFLLAISVLSISTLFAGLYFYHDYKKSIKRIEKLMEEEADVLMTLTANAAANSINSMNHIQKGSRQHLLNLAEKIYSDFKILDLQHIKNLSQSYDVDRIFILDSNGKLVLSNSEDRLNAEHFEQNRRDLFEPIINGDVDTLFLGVRYSRNDDKIRVALARSLPKGGAVVVAMDAGEMDELRKQTGLGALLKSFTLNNEEILYSMYLDSNDILVAVGRLPELPEWTQDSAWIECLHYPEKNILKYSEDYNTLEVNRSLVLKDQWKGLLKIGLDLRLHNETKAQIKISSLMSFVFVLLSITSLFLVMVFRKQTILLGAETKSLRDYATAILNAVDDQILIADDSTKLQSYNQAAAIKFNLTEAALGQDLKALQIPEALLFSEEKLSEVYLKPQTQSYLVSRKDLRSNAKTISIYILKDITELNHARDMVTQNQQLKALGELASGVAHEVRNPLNSISTIIQQLAMDFKPAENPDEYRMLTSLVLSEVKRMNQTISNFLKFSRPESINASFFNLNEFISEIVLQFKVGCTQKEIGLKIKVDPEIKVEWDHNQMKQVFVNLMENSIRAIGAKGEIQIIAERIIKQTTLQNLVRIIVQDTGKGMSPEVLLKARDLYFTTEASGSGIGLSVVQKIISAHLGEFRIESEPNQGTSIILDLPEKV
jgi:signal transduction histidine kinase